MADNNYEIYTQNLLPTWMLTKDKLPYFDVSGDLKDEAASAAVDAVQDSFIQTAPVDALSHIGVNDYIERPENFSDAQYRAKLQRSWDIWNRSGTPNLLISEIKELGLTNVGILPEFTEVAPFTFIETIPGLNEIGITSGRTYQSAPITEEQTNFWSNFWLILGQPHPFKPLLWGNFTWGGIKNGIPILWGDIDGDPTLVARMIRIIKQYKPAWTCCRGIVFILEDGKVWDSFNWGAMGAEYGIFPSKWGVQRIFEDWEIFPISL